MFIEFDFLKPLAEELCIAGIGVIIEMLRRFLKEKKTKGELLDVVDMTSDGNKMLLDMAFEKGKRMAAKEIKRLLP